LNSAQKNYTTIEKELLSIVATFKDFHTMLFGARITVYTDHKNLSFHNLMSQRVMGWRNFLKEYSPKFIYIERPLNVSVDAFLCLPRQPSTEGESTVGPWTYSTCWTYSTHRINFYSFHFDDDNFLDCFLNQHPPLTEMQFSLDYQLIQQNQFKDEQLQQIRQQRPQEYPIIDMGNDVHLICQVRPNRPWRICMPTNMITDIIRWYHLVLGHAGIV
jgi:hypothetical protein